MTTKAKEDLYREEFEKDYTSNALAKEVALGVLYYANPNIQAAWNGFKTARKAAQVEIDKLKSQSHILSSWEEMKVNLKSLEQENERLKKQTSVKRCMACGNIAMTNHGCEIMDQLKEREELIKEAIKVVERAEFALHPEFNGGSEGGAIKDCSYWLEKAKKLVGDK